VCMLTDMHTGMSRCVLSPKINYKHTSDAHFQTVTENVWFSKTWCLCIFLPILHLSSDIYHILLYSKMGLYLNPRCIIR